MVQRTLIFLDRLHWLWLALAAPFLLFPSPKRSLAMLIVPGLFLLRWLTLKGKQQMDQGETQVAVHHRPSIIPCTPLNGALLLVVLMVLVSLWATIDINYSLPKISGMVLGLGIFFAFAREGQNPRGWWLGFLLFMVIGVGIAAIGLLGTHWITKIGILNPIVSRLSPRITGLPGAEEGFHPNYIAGALLWVIPSCLTTSWLFIARAKDMRGFFGRRKTNASIVLMIGTSLLMIAILILTQSREGYISLTLTLPMLILIGLPPKRRWYGLAVLTFLAIILGVILALHWGTVRTWIVGTGVSADSAFSLDSLSARLEIWSNAFYGIQDFPFTGMGMNIFRKEMPLLYPLVNISPEMDIGHAHNEFLQAGLDLGIPGLIAFIALYIITFWMLIRTWKCMRVNLQPSALGQGAAIPSTKPRGRFSVIDISPFVDTGLIRMVVLGLGVGLLAHMLWGLTDAMALGARPAFIFWILLGLISGLHQQAQDHWAVKDNIIFSKRPANGLGK